MPNSSLYGKEYSVPNNILSILKRTNSQRSGNILDKGKISYSLLKRLKNDFDYLEPGSEEYEQYGGNIVKNWVNEILRNNRSDVHDIKKNQMDTGMFNRFKKEHSKDKNKNSTQPSGIDTKHKEFMRENRVVRITESELRLIIENILIEQNNINPELEKYKKESDMKIWFLENVVDKVEEKTHQAYPDSIFYVDKNTDEAYMEYNKKDGYLNIHYDKIWSIFQSNYSYNDMEIRQLIKFLMEEYYGLEDIDIPLVNIGYTEYIL